MLGTIIKRVLQGVLVLAGVLVITFFLVRAIPGDPAKIMAPQASDEQRMVLREQLGLNEPVFTQFVNYLGDLLHGDWGYSYYQKTTVINVIGQCWYLTAYLVLGGMVIALLLGVPLGILAALKNNTWVDRLISGVALFFQSMPAYLVGPMLAWIIAIEFKWLPSTGYSGFKSIILPSICLGLPVMSVFIRTVRINLMDSMNQDFAKAATARGVRKFAVLFKYTFRNSLMPILTVIGSQLGYMVGSCILVEFIFGYPGLGTQVYQAISRRDYFLIQTLVVLLASIFVVVNIIIDISYIYLDPRIRKAQGGL